MADCIVRSGESVDPSDSRLSDTACIIEMGVIIRPPPDLTMATNEAPPPAQSAATTPQPLPAAKVSRVTAPALPKVEEAPQQPAVELNSEEQVSVSRSPASVAHTVAPEPAKQSPVIEDPGLVNPTTIMVAAGAAVAVAGTAVAGSAFGGLSAIQAKIASIFGTSKGAVVTATVVTAGTIVAVKALEKKMNTLEKDLEKTKEEVGSAASSIDRIDALLDRLGS